MRFTSLLMATLARGAVGTPVALTQEKPGADRCHRDALPRPAPRLVARPERAGGGRPGALRPRPQEQLQARAGDRHVHRPLGHLHRLGAEQDRRQADHDRHRRGPPPRGGRPLQGSRRGARSSTRGSADAHDLVPKLEGPFDFVFIDADKEWYTNYAKAVLPKLTVGGLLTAHNVSPVRRPPPDDGRLLRVDQEPAEPRDDASAPA